jgi:hypothetical protein
MTQEDPLCSHRSNNETNEGSPVLRCGHDVSEWHAIVLVDPVLQQ